MATTGVVGSVAGLWRFPVKSMRGERLEQADLLERGLVGDRAYALIDTDTGKVVSAKSVRLFPDLFSVSATFVEPPRAATSAYRAAERHGGGQRLQRCRPRVVGVFRTGCHAGPDRAG